MGGGVIDKPLFEEMVFSRARAREKEALCSKNFAFSCDIVYVNTEVTLKTTLQLLLYSFSNGFAIFFYSRRWSGYLCLI